MFNKIEANHLIAQEIICPPGCEPKKISRKAKPKNSWGRDSVSLSHSSRHKSTKICQPQVSIQGMKQIDPDEPPQQVTLIEYPCEPMLNPDICIREDHYGFMDADRPNFRKVEGIYGTGQPNFRGLKKIITDLGGGSKKIYWTNLRAEPVIYIKDEPYSLRSHDDIDYSLIYPNVDTGLVEKMEKDFKAEVLDKMKKGEPVEFCGEGKDGKVCEIKYPPGSLKSEDVKTLTEIFKGLKKYNIDYQRVPIDDNRRPSNQDFDSLVKRYNNYDPHAEYITNCMGGWGRTTTSMTIFNIMRSIEDKNYRPLSQLPAIREEIKAEGKGNFKKLRTMFTAVKVAETLVKHGIIKGNGGDDFLKIIEDEGKSGCPICLEISRAAKEDPKRVSEYVERYLYLAYFYQYSQEHDYDNYPVTFSDWIKPHESKIKMMTSGLSKLFKAEAWLDKHWEGKKDGQ